MYYFLSQASLAINHLRHIHRLISNFESFYFFLFLLISIALYYLFKRSKYILLLLCIIFYASFSLNLTIFIGFIALLNYILGIILYLKRDKKVLILAILCNAGPLIYYKYSNFLINNIQNLHLLNGIPTLENLVIPLGISFFTFELIHYIVDVYKGKKPVFNIVEFFLFVFFFPTLIAGPIKRFENFIPQIKKPKVNWDLITYGTFLIIKGLFKKIVLANTLGNFVSYGFENTNNSLLILLGIYAFSLQIYFDFSGYTDIGRGSAAILGIKIPENFLSPYLAQNIQDFWRRWHITLMSWLRDYLYIPLGGSRKKRTWNILIVFFASGLWHGAAWHYVIWGMYHGALMIIHRALSPLKSFGKLNKYISIFITFNLVTFGWIFFRSKDTGTALGLISKIFTFNVTKINAPVLVKILSIGTILFMYVFVPIIMGKLISRPKIFSFAKLMSYAVALAFIFVYAPPVYTPFIYFQF